MQGRHFHNDLDKNFDWEKNYFFKRPSESCWSNIREFLNKFLALGNTETKSLAEFFNKYPSLKKGSENLVELRKILDETATLNKTAENFFESYKTVNDYIFNEFAMAKPAVLDCIFFPSTKNEDVVINMLRTCKDSLYICIFTLTNNKIFAAVEEVWNEDVDVKIITDDTCCGQEGSDIYKLAAMGVPVKTDNSERFHMHHKFAVIDNAVVITGSFNWTTQAVQNNQENVLFIENKYIANKYTQEFENLWDSFAVKIDPKVAQKKVDEEKISRKKNYNYHK